jgi:phospholipid/cholesterol/gamma-HCH transport system substrate-binding protein
MGRSKSVAVGIFVLGGFLLFVVGLFMIGDRRQLFSSSIELYAEYLEVGGLLVGAPVKVGGLGAGEVLSINVPPNPESRFKVTFRVLEKFRPLLRTDSVATIQTDGIVGNKFLQVDAGTSAGAEVVNGSMIQSREPFEFADLMQQVSDTVGTVNQTVSEVKEDFEKTIQTITETTERAGTLITNVSDEVTGVAAAGNRISNDVSDIVAGVKAGEGTVGKLFTDDQLYRNLRASADDIGKTVQNFRQTSNEVQEMVTDLKTRGLVDDVDQTIANVKDMSERAKKAISDFQPDEGGGLMTDMRQTLASARVTMENMSENTEALKRSFFFRGYFKDRGFYDLNSISTEDYKTGIAAPGYPQKREWLHVNELFFVDPEGKEVLSDEGKKKADEAMAALLPHAKDQPIMVEGYAGEGTAADQFLKSNERAHLIRDYLLERFALRANYVGIMPMGSVKPEISGGQPWEGVSVVLFSNRKEDRPQ